MADTAEDVEKEAKSVTADEASDPVKSKEKEEGAASEVKDVQKNEASGAAEEPSTPVKSEGSKEANALEEKTVRRQSSSKKRKSSSKRLKEGGEKETSSSELKKAPSKHSRRSNSDIGESRGVEEGDVPRRSKSSRRSHSSSSGKLRRSHSAHVLKRTLTENSSVSREEFLPAMKGVLYKQRDTLKFSWRRRFFVLTDYYLYYYEGQQEHSGAKRHIDLMDIKVEKTDKKPNSFVFRARNTTVHVYAETKEEMDEWIEAVTSAARYEMGQLLRSGMIGVTDHVGTPFVPQFIVLDREKLTLHRSMKEREPIDSVDLFASKVISRRRENRQFALRLADRREIYFLTETTQEYDDWVKAIEKNISERDMQIERIDKALKLWKNTIIRKAFGRWTEFIGEKKRMKNLLLQASGKFHNFAVAKCFNRWKVYVVERKEMKRKAQQAISYFTKRLLVTSFKRWKNFVYTTQHEEESRVDVINFWKNRLLRKGFNGLKEVLEQRKEKLQRVHQVTNMWKNRKMLSFFQAWKRFTLMSKMTEVSAGLHKFFVPSAFEVTGGTNLHPRNARRKAPENIWDANSYLQSIGRYDTLLRIKGSQQGRTLTGKVLEDTSFIRVSISSPMDMSGSTSESSLDYLSFYAQQLATRSASPVGDAKILHSSAVEKKSSEQIGAFREDWVSWMCLVETRRKSVCAIAARQLHLPPLANSYGEVVIEVSLDHKVSTYDAEQIALETLNTFALANDYSHYELKGVEYLMNGLYYDPSTYDFIKSKFGLEPKQYSDVAKKMGAELSKLVSLYMMSPNLRPSEESLYPLKSALEDTLRDAEYLAGQNDNIKLDFVNVKGTFDKWKDRFLQYLYHCITKTMNDSVFTWGNIAALCDKDETVANALEFLMGVKSATVYTEIIKNTREIRTPLEEKADVLIRARQDPEGPVRSTSPTSQSKLRRQGSRTLQSTDSDPNLEVRRWKVEVVEELIEVLREDVVSEEGSWVDKITKAAHWIFDDLERNTQQKEDEVEPQDSNLAYLGKGGDVNPERSRVQLYLGNKKLVAKLLQVGYFEKSFGYKAGQTNMSDVANIEDVSTHEDVTTTVTEETSAKSGAEISASTTEEFISATVKIAIQNVIRTVEMEIQRMKSLKLVPLLPSSIESPSPVTSKIMAVLFSLLLMERDCDLISAVASRIPLHITDVTFRDYFFKLGGLNSLIAHYHSADPEIVASVGRALISVTTEEAGKTAALNCALVPILAYHLASNDFQLIRYAAVILNNLTSHPQALQQAVENGVVRSILLILKNYHNFESKHDDCIAALASAVWGLSRVSVCRKEFIDNYTHQHLGALFKIFKKQSLRTRITGALLMMSTEEPELVVDLVNIGMVPILVDSLEETSSSILSRNIVGLLSYIAKYEKFHDELIKSGTLRATKRAEMFRSEMQMTDYIDRLHASLQPSLTREDETKEVREEEHVGAEEKVSVEATKAVLESKDQLNGVVDEGGATAAQLANGVQEKE